MKVEISVKKEVEMKLLVVKASVRYWEDTEIDGVPDTEDGDNVPCKEGDDWCPYIDIDTGKIINWKIGTMADVHYKVCDGFGYEIHDENGQIIQSAEDGYVPSTMSPKGSGYGDYIIMDIDENGMIQDWDFDFSDFESDED